MPSPGARGVAVDLKSRAVGQREAVPLRPAGQHLDGLSRSELLDRPDDALWVVLRLIRRATAADTSVVGAEIDKPLGDLHDK